MQVQDLTVKVAPCPVIGHEGANRFLVVTFPSFPTRSYYARGYERPYRCRLGDSSCHNPFGRTVTSRVTVLDISSYPARLCHAAVLRIERWVRHTRVLCRVARMRREDVWGRKPRSRVPYPFRTRAESKWTNRKSGEISSSSLDPI